VRAKGFEIEEGNSRVAIWANARTGDPVRVENMAVGPAAQPGLPANRQLYGLLTNFRVNPDFDPALFSTDPPPDYQLIRSPTVGFRSSSSP
jgi:outer membrane lipoprotein-sorting protein